MKFSYKKLIFWALVVVQISAIFSFSFQNAEQSSFLSAGVTEKVKSRDWIEMKLEQQTDETGQKLYKSEYAIKKVAEQKSDTLEKVIRKIAHAFLFFILGMLFILLILTYGIERKIAALVGVLYSISIAFVDETIQLFSKGRAGLFTDVMIDAGGAIFAALLFTVGGILYEKNKKKHGKVDCEKI